MFRLTQACKSSNEFSARRYLSENDGTLIDFSSLPAQLGIRTLKKIMSNAVFNAYWNGNWWPRGASSMCGCSHDTDCPKPVDEMTKNVVYFEKVKQGARRKWKWWKARTFIMLATTSISTVPILSREAVASKLANHSPTSLIVSVHTRELFAYAAKISTSKQVTWWCNTYFWKCWGGYVLVLTPIGVGGYEIWTPDFNHLILCLHKHLWFSIARENFRTSCFMNKCLSPETVCKASASATKYNNCIPRTLTHGMIVVPASPKAIDNQGLVKKLRGKISIVTYRETCYWMYRRSLVWTQDFRMRTPLSL